MEKRDLIRNPLTLIATFAGLSEVAMTSVLPFLPPENQRIFMWFVMFYPFLLVILFFYVLIWKREALYAPSDFKDDATWFAVLKDKERKLLEKYPLERAIEAPVKTDKTISVEKDAVEHNPFYRFLTSLGLTSDDIKLVVMGVDNADELPDSVNNKLSNKEISDKIKSVLSEFERSRDDFIRLKTILKGDDK